MKRKHKLIPLELQKQADKILEIVPELQGGDDIDQAAGLIKEYTNLKESMNAYAYAYAFIMSNHWSQTKLIYEFDKTLVEELTAQTDLAVASEMLKRMPSTSAAKKTIKTTEKRPVRHWDVGIRVGATIKRNRSQAATPRESGDHKQHARPRPHLRRGHWSHFWTGKRDSADRERILKWIEPVYINADSSDDLPTTIHKVK